MPASVFTALLVTMSVLLVIAAALFFAGHLRRTEARFATHWAAAFVAAVLCSGAYFVCARTDDVWWAVAVGNGSMAFTLGALWAGCRVYNGRRSLIAVVAVVCLAVAVVSSLPSPDGSKWAGAAEKSIALAAFSILIVIECLRAPLRRRIGSWFLVVTLAVHAVYVTARSVAFLTVGHESAVFETWFSTQTVTALNVVLVAAASVGIIAIGVQDLRALRSYRAADGRRQRVLRPRAFWRSALALPLSEVAVVAVAEIDLLGHYRRAYGVAFANAAMDTLVEAVLTAGRADSRAADAAGEESTTDAATDAAAEAGAAEVCGRLARDRLTIVSTGRSAEELLRFAAAVQRQYAERSTTAEATFASIGLVAVATDPGERFSRSRLEALIAEARNEISWDPELGLGRLHLSDRSTP